MESFITNPGFQHLGQNILRHFGKEKLLSLRLVNHACKKFVENPRFWLKKLNYKKSGLVELHEAWSTLIRKVEEENPDLEQNVAKILIKLVGQEDFQEIIPLEMLCIHEELVLLKFTIKHNIVECLSRNSKGLTPIHYAASSNHKEIIKIVIGCTDNPNAPDNNGMTPIHIAAMQGHTEIVKILTGCTDNPNAPDDN